MKEYIAKKITAEMTVDDERWNMVEPAAVDYVWDDCFPSPFVTEARFVHSDNGYTLLITTNEWPLYAGCLTFNGSVCIDSCAEFFFIPNETDDKYMNFEINPVGMLHLAIGSGRGERSLLDPKGEVSIVNTVRAGEEWRLMLHIPYSYLKKYYSELGSVIRGNFYKCADKAPVKHYAAWSPISTPAPDFHRPEYFGRIVLSDDLL